MVFESQENEDWEYLMWRASRPPPTSGFVLNLDGSITKWDSTTVNEVDVDHPDYEQMVSFHEYQEPKADDEQMAPFFKLMEVLASSNHEDKVAALKDLNEMVSVKPLPRTHHSSVECIPNEVLAIFLCIEYY